MNADMRLVPPLGTPVARALLALFLAVHALLAAAAGPTPFVWTVAALVACGSAASIVVLAPGGALPQHLTVTAIALAAVGAAAIVPWLPDAGWPGYASWPTGAVTFIAVALTLRFRFAAAWGLMAALVILCIFWSVRAGTGPLPGIGLIDRQVGTLFIGSLFALGLRRAADTAAAFHLAQHELQLAQSAARSETIARRQAVREITAIAGPTLQRIARLDPLNDEDRAGVLALEGRLRDDITLRALRSEPLNTALRAARLRGVDVVVLSDAQVARAPARVRARAAEWLTARLAGAESGSFVARVLPRGNRLRVSATTDTTVEDQLLDDEE